MKYLFIIISVTCFSLLGLYIWHLDLRIKQFRTFREANGTEFHTIHFMELSKLHGYQAEWHSVTTADGYILSIFRVPPNPKYHNASVNERVIYLQHSLASSADSYIFFGRGRSLAYTLSDAGYDVWLGNFRGNSYSRKHRILSPSDPEFWNFSMDEHALLDTPAMLDYILNSTKQPTLTYIGFSLSTTTMLMLLSAKPEYNHKLNVIALLGPVSYWKTRNSIRTFSSRLTEFLRLLSPTGQVEVPSSILLPLMVKYFCFLNDFLRGSCSYVYHSVVASSMEALPIMIKWPQLLTGIHFFKKTNCINQDKSTYLCDHSQWNISETNRDTDELPEILCYYIAGASGKVFYHYAQHIQSGKFHRYDYRSEKLNYKYYGQSHSPEYNVTYVTVPIIIFQGPNDPVSTKEDVDRFVDKLPANNTVIYETVQYEKFHHADFVFAKDVERSVYDRLLEIIEHFHSCKIFL